MTSVPLSTLTTMQVGGPARELITVTTREQLIEAAVDTWDSNEPWLILGGGSNTIVADEGFDGTVIHVVTTGIERQQDISKTPNHSTVRVAAGENWDALVQWSISEGLAGIEALSGIPGSTGAAPIQNIGAYGQELSSVLTAVEFLDRYTQEISWIPASELALGYRESVFKQGKEGVVLTVELSLASYGDSLSAPIAFPQLATALGVELGTQVALAKVRETVLKLRASKGMVLDPADPDTASAGSFFMNPIVTENFARHLPADAPRFPVKQAEHDRVLPLGAEVPPLASASGPNLVKLSAAWLIENAGVKKGYSVPGSKAGISTKHTLAITNRGGATAAEVVGLATYVQAMVQSHFGIILYPEPNLIGVEV
ncbi:UDP-N-acetylmuramate dehydrogenase [uncultured Aurantimicrobium sp.]|uniref:UDP-N-acetylmuramate dehydrogenase n=1 Tax=uncultured Aurantimicrobium sp. TaxID=1705357 RepID=UPI00262441BD|nr:UDP-N-acetylmuramate dehydrogenase [uncultured Aurantimicrobium sp.]